MFFWILLSFSKAAFCTSEYGAKTGAQYETYFEVQFCHQHSVPIFPVKLCPTFPPEPSDEAGRMQNKFVLTTDLIYAEDLHMNRPEEIAEKISTFWQKLPN